MKSNGIKGVLTLMICFVMSSINAQVQIVNSDKVKIITNENVLKIAIGEVNDSKDYWVSTVMTGKIHAITEDSIEVHVSKMKVNILDGNQKTASEYDLGDAYNSQSFAKSDLNYLAIYKSTKGKKFRRNLSAASVLLFFGGAITGLSSLAIKDKDNRKDILKIGGATMGAGLILGISLNKKKYLFKNTDDPWRFEG